MNPQRQRFINAYLGEANGNATKAAIIAGYSEHTATQIASRLLTSVEVQAAIEKRLNREGLTVDDAISELATIAQHQVKDIQPKDKLKAIELFLKAKGALKEKDPGARVTVNIGFLGTPQQAPTAISVTAIDITEAAAELGHGASALSVVEVVPNE